MSLADLLSRLRAREIECRVEGDRLRLRAPEGALTPELQAELTQRKPEIVAYLRTAHAAEAGALPPLTKADRSQDLPLSFDQERLWFLHAIEPENTAYNLQAVLPLPGTLDVAALARALAELVRRHEILRTTFPERDGRPIQVVAPASASVALAHHDLAALEAEPRTTEARRLATLDVSEPFDLARGPLVRFRLLRLDEHRYDLLVTQHHILTDGWSIALLLEEIVTLYAASAAGLPSPLPDPAFQYGDYASWQRQVLTGDRLASRVAYWKERLAGAPPALDLPADRPRPERQTFAGAAFDVLLPETLAAAVRAAAREEGVTPFTLLFAAFAVVLRRYSGQTDVVAGTANGQRGLVETERMLGLFVNSLVLRTDLSGDPTGRELIGRVRDTVTGAFTHGDLPFERLVQAVQPPRDLARSPVFQVLFVLQNTPLETLVQASGTVAGAVADRRTAGYELTVTLLDSGRGLRATFEYNTDLFDEATMRRLAGQYEAALGALVTGRDRPLSRWSLLSEAERQTLLVEWNATAREVEDAPVTELIARRAADRPEATAVIAGSGRLTYAELEEKAQRLAVRLRDAGVRHGSRVGLYTEREVETVVGLLGILKAGAAYVPLDPAYPRERIAWMIEDARPAAVLATRKLMSDLPATEAAILELGSIADVGESRVDTPICRDDVAYVLFTSGSTGRPKGVVIPHGALTNLLLSMAEAPGFGASDTMLAVTTLSFDIAALEVFLPLVQGGTVVLASRDEAADPVRLGGLLETSGATVMQATPATWRMLLDAGWRQPGLKVLCGGEALPADLARALRAACRDLWNVYGPTETTIWSTAEHLDVIDGTVTIGRPIANTAAYVLDAHLQPVPLGAVGELYLGGQGVAHGYLGRPDLTAERFVPDPWGRGTRLYRTGDLARHRPDGRLECLGRVDHQVKVRGFRIELGEIEAALEALPAVRAAAVVPQDGGRAGTKLVAYVVFGAGEEPTVTEMRRALKSRLPAYMVPGSFIVLDRLPLTPNGKTDRWALARLQAPAETESRRAVPPRTPMERLIAGLWSEALGTPKVGAHDNFFDIGGHSLLSVRVLARLEAAVGIRLNPREMIFHTVEQIAALCEQQLRATGRSLPAEVV